MRISAPLRLKRLLTGHAQTTYVDWHNGVAMWRELIALKNTAGISEEQDAHDDELDRARKTPLPDGASAQEYADKVNDLQRNHIPYLQ